MFSNQQLKESRVLARVTPRLLGLMAFFAAAVLLAGCQTAPEEFPRAAAPPPPPAAAESADPANDMTATEAAIAAMNEMAPAEAPAQNDESAPKRRGRPPKSRPSAPLFADGSQPEAVTAAALESAEAPVAARPVAA